jgi:hypothetical protein
LRLIGAGPRLVQTAGATTDRARYTPLLGSFAGQSAANIAPVAFRCALPLPSVAGGVRAGLLVTAKNKVSCAADRSD